MSSENQEKNPLIQSQEKQSQDKDQKQHSPIIQKIIKIYRFLQHKVECPEAKQQFHQRKEQKTPKFRGQIHNYGKWFSLIPSALLVYHAQSNQARRYAILYGVAVFWMQYISSKMHCRPYQSAPTWIRKIDNISIFIYIGINWLVIGSQLMSDDPSWNLMRNVLLFIMVLAISIRALTLHSPRWIISGLALLMGWLCVLRLPTIVSKLNLYELIVFGLGGLSISLGAVCWALQIQLPFVKHKSHHTWTPHETFHLGSVLMMIFFYLLLFSLQVTHPGHD